MKHKGAYHTGDTEEEEDFENPDLWAGYEGQSGPNKKKTDTWYFRQCSDDIPVERWVQNISMFCMRAYE
jgi:hypothetical protein